MRIKRSLIMLALASILAITTAATALAQTTPPPAAPAATAAARPHAVRGLVTAMSERGFRVKNLRGEAEAVLVNDKTRFRLPGQKDVTFADLKVGDRVTVLGGKPAAGVFTARLVNIEPRRPRIHAAAGTVTAVSATSLSITNLRGDLVTFVINDKTRIVPKDAVIQVGDKVAVAGVQPWGEKDIVAKIVTIRRDPAPKQL